MSTTSLYAIVVGVGPGTGASIARVLGKAYPVACLARTPASYEEVVKDINSSGGKAVGISTDVSNAQSVNNAFAQAQKELGADACAAAVFNASGGFNRKPFLETTEQEFQKAYDVSVKGAFLFAQAALPALLKAVASSKYPPTLIFTGATASVKSNAMMSSFSTGKYAKRALSQSLGKEFGPKGIHVAHAVIDGVIDIPRTQAWKIEGGPDAKISPDAVSLIMAGKFHLRN